MKNRFFDMFLTEERKRFNHLISLIDKKRYNELFVYDDNNKFGLTSSKLYDQLIIRINQEALNNPYFLIAMSISNYRGFEKIIKYVLKFNPNIIDEFINKNFTLDNNIILFALDNGYNPSSDFINKNIRFFSDSSVILKLIDKGYFPTMEFVENYRKFFFEPKIISKLIDFGFVPSIKFISDSNLLRNPELLDKIFEKVEITSEFLNSKSFLGNALAQKKVITERPELLKLIVRDSELYKQFSIEAFKLGFIPENVTENDYITQDFTLFSRLVKQKPEMVKYCKLYNKEEKNRIDDLALSMGYIPTIADVKNFEYVKKSPKLIKALISNRPEAIKYIETRPLRGGYSLNITNEEFLDLVRYALDNGYIPTEKDVENNPRLLDSFDIMKILIQDNPNMINSIRNETLHKEELLKIAIANGFNDFISSYYIGTDNHNDLLYTETAIMYQVNRGYSYESDGDRYSIELYNFFIDKGFELDSIIDLFTGNFEIMKEIISDNPEYINKISNELSRKEIDELAFLAIDKGYIPKEEDKIFGYGSEAAKLMVKLYPSYLESVSIYDRFGLFSVKLSDIYHDVCKLAVDGGYMPDVDKLGNGYGMVTVDKYNSSYDIMKKAISIRPELIESCTVENKEQYDELCDIAISKGYEVTNSYALTHWGEKMCSNYNLMARYLKNKPEFILYVDINNSEEMVKLIDIAIESGLRLYSLEDNQLLKLFLKVDESKWSDYLDSSKIISLRKAKELKANNDEIANTVDPKFLNDHIISHFTKAQVEILSCYPVLQKKIVELSSDSYKFKIVSELVNKYNDNLEWIPILEKVLVNIDSVEYSNLLMSIKSIELSDKEKEELMYLLMTDNHLDISTLDELKNVEKIRENYINTLIERNTLGSLKAAYFEKVYGIDLSTAINLVTLYGKSLEGNAINSLDEKSRKEFVLLENMKKIINLDNIEILKYYVDNVNPSFVVKPDLMVTYEARLKYLFTNEFNNSLTKPVAEDKFVSTLSGEEDLDIYLAAGRDGKKKCRMMITSIGAYTNMEEPDDYYASWNVDKIASHGCCCSYIGEKNLGTAEVKYCCLGFTDYELGSLQLSAPYDLCSMSDEKSYEISAIYSSMFLLPDDVLDYTRHTHNETVWERRNISKDAMFKKQPSYIVYFVDNFDDRLTDPEAQKQWESVKKAAANFSREVNGEKKYLPIMVVEREKIAKAQLGNIQNQLNEFTETGNSKLIKGIISDYESNYAGNREYHLNISDKYFPKHEHLSESVVGKIIETINKLYQTDPNRAYKCLYELEKVLKSEQEKYNNTQHGVGQSLPSFNIEEALIECNKLKSKYRVGKDSTIAMINNCENNNRQYDKSDLSSLEPNFAMSQISALYASNLLVESGLFNKFVILENEIKQEGVNVDLKVHGQRHVKNVLLYAALIGQEVIENKNDLNLVLLAAKYHDVGRKTDAHEEHADASADIAVEKLKDTCSQEELAIIKTIIQFHEFFRNSYNEDETFEEIAKKNGIPVDKIAKVREMSEVLKDADALDRTRFINKARLNSKFLKFDISKRLIKFSSSLQESYAIQDLKEYNMDDKIKVLLEKYTPQEVLRTIRHSNKGKTRIEDIQSFIEMWANSLDTKENELDEMFDEINISKESVTYNGK